MLYPRTNEHRLTLDLSGFWDFRPDPDDSGLSLGWSAGFAGGKPIAVPASWNDQFAEGRDFLGPAWYSTVFTLPDVWRGQTVSLRFDSVNYLADVWLNGHPLGTHEGGHLPFELDTAGHLSRGQNNLVVRVDGRLAPDRVPPGAIVGDPPDTFGNTMYPPASFDFFPFCGIQRPVHVCRAPPGGIRDIAVDTRVQGHTASVHVRVVCERREGTMGITLFGHGWTGEARVALAAGVAVGVIEVPKPCLWAPDHPDLYTLTARLMEGGTAVDSYTLRVGIRSISVQGDTLLLNGEPLRLTGFGRHEDFPVTGRGLLNPVIIKDYALMEWVGANSFRTTHYPYSEQAMELADRLGFLVIDETPAVGLFFREEGLERRLELCRTYVRELIERDRNHPCVIAWSVANEPHSRRPAAKGFFRDLYDTAKNLDPTRPVTLASYTGRDEEAFEFCDIVCLNRYFGWYSESGRIREGCERLSRELDEIHTLYPKPLVLTEFGADTISGFHALEPEMFSEEYQSEFLRRYIEVLRSKPYVVGEHVWNLCDFKTSQEVKRFGGMNLKGVFTRDRRPKMAAHTLRELWRKTRPV